jgi:hypothetical protein
VDLIFRELKLTEMSTKRLREAYGFDHPAIALPLTLASEIRSVGWVELAGTPKYRRRIVTGSYWEVNVESDPVKTAAELELNPDIARVSLVFGHTPGSGLEEVLWVHLDWLVRDDSTLASTPGAIGCPMYRRANEENVSAPHGRRMMSPNSLIRPAHLLHCCTEGCGVGLTGTVGYVATNELGRHHVEVGDYFVRNPWYLK